MSEPIEPAARYATEDEAAQVSEHNPAWVTSIWEAGQARTLIVRPGAKPGGTPQTRVVINMETGKSEHIPEQFREAINNWAATL